MSRITLPWIALLFLIPCVALAAAEAQLRRASFLGVQISDVASAAGANGGVVVIGLVDGGSASAAGLRAGDIVVGLNETPVKGRDDFVRSVAGLSAGNKVRLRFVRDGVARSTEATIRPRPSESAPDVDTEYHAVVVDGVARRTLLTRPRSAGRHPAVLYLTGIGCYSQESAGVVTTEAKLLYSLTRAGFVTMRVEKSGIGDSQGLPCTDEKVDLRAEVRGYQAGLHSLRDYDYVDRDNVFLLGLSIGGVEAPIVAQQGGTKGIVVINTVARAFLDYLQEIRRTQGVLRGTPYDTVEARLRLNGRCNFRLLVEHEAPTTLLERTPECREFIEYPAPLSYMQQWADLDPAAEWKQVSSPVLVLHGEFDFISSAVDATYLRDMIETFHPGNATLATVPAMDHYLARVGSWSESLANAGGRSTTLQDALVDTISTWMKRQIR